MALFLLDDATARHFEPFALTRPVSELRAGTELIRRRWEIALGEAATGTLVAPHLAEFEELDAPRAATGTLPAGAIVANARCVAKLSPAAFGAETNVWHCGGRIAAVRLAEPVDAASLANLSVFIEELAARLTTVHEATLEGRWLNEVWDLIGMLGEQLAEDIPLHASRLETAAPAAATGVVVLGSHPVCIEEGATVEPFVVFDVAAGPVLVRRGATVQAFTRVIGPCYIGEGSTVVADRIANSSIGDVCKIHGEMSTSIVLGHSNKGHDGFVGHSYLGRWVNLGAGTTTSNLKNTYGTVALWTPQGVRDTKLQFLGTMFGDHVKTGIGLRLTTGCVLGAGANVFNEMPPKVVPPFAWGGTAPYDTYDLDKFLLVAERAMKRRHVELTPRERAQLKAAYDARWSVR
jgi:UDP-N-acetylglucosamine diphosphorylase/glucosamine-1-phosphate N-acetyltransferase